MLNTPGSQIAGWGVLHVLLDGGSSPHFLRNVQEDLATTQPLSLLLPRPSHTSIVSVLVSTNRGSTSCHHSHRLFPRRRCTLTVALGTGSNWINARMSQKQ